MRACACVCVCVCVCVLIFVLFVSLFEFIYYESHMGSHKPKLQALVYDILPSTTAVFSYAVGSRKLS